MARRKESTLQIIATMPWPAGLALGLLGFVGIRRGIGWVLSDSQNPMMAVLGNQASQAGFAPLAWVFLVACVGAAFASFLGRRKRRHLLGSQTGLESLRAMDWREFELLVGEAYRRQGYAVDETGLGGPDGGVDVRLRKGGQTTLVQCKQWRTRTVGVSVVREMYGLMTHERADAVKIVGLAGFTVDAYRFARGKPVELVDGGALLATVARIQSRNESAGLLDNTLCFASSATALLLIALFVSSDGSSRSPSPPPMASAPTPVEVPAPMTLQPSRPLPAPAAVARPHPAQTPTQVFRAEPAMTGEDLREWDRKNREAMKILEKTTPELEAPPPQ